MLTLLRLSHMVERFQTPLKIRLIIYAIELLIGGLGCGFVLLLLLVFNIHVINLPVYDIYVSLLDL